MVKCNHDGGECGIGGHCDSCPWTHIKALEAKYQALVDAAVGQYKANRDSLSPLMREAAQPFLPPILLSEKLDKLADANENSVISEAELHDFADEARELEK